MRGGNSFLNYMLRIMRLYVRCDRGFSFTVIPVIATRHDIFKKEWLIYVFNVRITVAWIRNPFN